ncbi:hypothetical protein Vau01_024410 [Virgisporangium aurantiacum]|uniref:DUF3558 domain-containing protein n=2 Tax=Virgisporangium aurantiacum TaxID=175570 RepID=A0A8J4DXU5_9ACTN|nr:hypothetical protein Vau01_024410 [Virgisporangium aurantiacum]
MKRFSTVLLAALVAVSLVGVAGCTKRKSKAGKSTSKSRKRSDSDADSTTKPATTRPSPSASTNDPVGKACSEILDQVNTATGVTWRLDDSQSQATPDTMRKGGARKCHFEMSSTATLPAAIMGLTLYRIDRRSDRGPEDVREHAEKQAKCTEKLPSPPAQLTLAVQCLERHGGTLFDVQTTLSGPTGYVLIFVSMQPAKASTTLDTKARDIGRKSADIALASL